MKGANPDVLILKQAKVEYGKLLLAFFQNDEGYDQRTVWHTILFDPELQIGAAEYTHL